MATANSSSSRNRTLGEMIGRGTAVADALASTPHVVEGVETTRVVLEIADALGIEMPISEVVSQVLFDGLAPHEAITVLMERAPTVEI